MRAEAGGHRDYEAYLQSETWARMRRRYRRERGWASSILQFAEQPA